MFNCINYKTPPEGAVCQHYNLLYYICINATGWQYKLRTKDCGAVLACSGLL
ncbi:UNVERIFIED_CONTAM: hypothetical protein FKN15_025098 [Acipenser sinensis]